MPWKIVKSSYDPSDLTTLHDDELVAIERSLREAIGQPRNEYNPAWRAWSKIRPLAADCTGAVDPVNVLPAGAAGDSKMTDD
jgi:hypothetical protein